MRLKKGSDNIALKLRNRLLALVMLISSAVLIAAFISIYVLAYIKINSDYSEELNNKEETIVTTISSDGEIHYGDYTSEAIIVNVAYPSSGVYFYLIVDKDGKLILVNTSLDMPEETYEYAAQAAFSRLDKTLEIEGRIWQYAGFPADGSVILDMSLVDGQIPNEYIYTDTEELFLIKFIDVTDSLNTLETLRFTLILTGVALLVILYFLSRFFAGRAITPLLEAWEKQRRFVADASHELKTPLSVISGNIDVLLNNRDETVESQIKWLQYAKSGTERMLALINHLLSLSKIEDYKTLPAITELDVGELIGDAIDHVRGLADAKQITVNEAIQPSVVMNTDYSMLRQAVDILLDNAIKYSPDNGLLEVRSNQTKTHILISVSNNGAGISEEDMPKIFDRFYRADKSRSHDNQSYGLGLSIAYSIMEKLGGKITASSIPNEITCFTLTFNRKN